MRSFISMCATLLVLGLAGCSTICTYETCQLPSNSVNQQIQGAGDGNGASAGDGAGAAAGAAASSGEGCSR